VDKEAYVAAVDEFAAQLDIALEKIRAFKDAYPLATTDGAPMNQLELRLNLALLQAVSSVEGAADYLRGLADEATALVSGPPQ
jgi:hypothetical protein